MALQERSRGQNFFLILLMGALNTITPITIDMYLPAFKLIASDLHTDMAHVALSVSTYFLGFSLGQILYGPLLDRFGRKPPLYIGLALYILATIGCALATSIDMFLLLRFVQALSGCVASVAAMAMVLDFFPSSKSARIISLLVLILGVSPLLAPTLGGLIVDIAHWRVIFYVLASIVVVILFFVFFFLPESQQPDTSVSLMPRPIITGFLTILKEPRFYIYSLAGTFSFSSLFVYVAGSPTIFMEEFRVSPQMYSAIFAGLSLGFIGNSQFNHVLTHRFRNEDIFRIVLIIQVIISIVFLMVALSGGCTIPVVLFFLFVILACSGLTYPNAAALAMAPFSRNAGTASALLGFIQIGVGGIISACVGALHLKGSLTVALVMAATSVLALVLLLLGKRKA